jgi:RNA polymerase sigma-70 factor (ECF subfamily)
MDDEAGRTAERVARESYGRLVAFLAARTRDVAGAEDALAEAFAAALQNWPRDGIPDNPAAWLLTAARRRQTDALRRRQTRAAGEEHLKLMAEEIDAAAAAPDGIPDRRLALMFACAHPEIEAGMRTPLILQTVLGLSAEAIAAAFLIPPATMGQRLVRAKARIRNAGIPFRIPDRDELPARLDAVLAAIYAAYTRDWDALAAEGPTSLAGEAIWLGRLIVDLLPDEPEAKGMLALMLYTEARQQARRDAGGLYVPLDEQDTSLWDDSRIYAAEALLHAANRAGPSGRYQIEAAIQSAHIAGRLHGVDNRLAVLALYDALFALTGSPVVTLNRAVALADLKGPAAALSAIAPLATDRRMASYQPYWAVLAHLSAECSDTERAHEAFTIAIGLSTDPAVRAWLDHRRAALQQG